MRSRNRNNTPLSLVLQAVFYYYNRTPGQYLLSFHPFRIILMKKFETFACMDQNILVLKTNQPILKFTIKFLKSSERFDDPLFL